MGFFDSFKKRDNEKGESQGEKSSDRNDRELRSDSAESSSSDALSSAVMEARKQAFLKEHQYRAGVISFVSVVMDDLQSVTENNYKALISMTVATLQNFIEAESKANADLLASVKEQK